MQIPAVLSRFIELPAASGESRFMLLEHLLMEYMPELFKGYNIISVSPFRITRNADLTIHGRRCPRSPSGNRKRIEEKTLGGCHSPGIPKRADG
ncbi:hypothetical protein [Sinobaca sp. H24]|uniref:hypothetical protein n=1 Tax=Sinobaca sp. H24 TaxID=2923376 RepID=UPI00207AACE6|nr:hypothetical protein [Sinobaca sp. H24]